MNIIWNKLSKIAVSGMIGGFVFFATPIYAEECNQQTMDAFAYEDCVNAKSGVSIDNGDSVKTKTIGIEAIPIYRPFNRDAYVTSSFGENRGTRYHAGFDYSTNMEEGWPIYAPEDGKVIELRVSPFLYGKLMLFKGNSGKTWAFAHQSSFGKLDELIIAKQYTSKKNDVTIKPGKSYKKGDTLTFAGSTGIGNPHLHLEVRLDNDRLLNPVLAGVSIADTIAPQIFGIAVWQGNHLAITTPEAIDKGCVETPVKNEYNLDIAVKIVDYSREPKENPMSVRRITLWRYDEKIFEDKLDTLRYSKMTQIRDQLLWAEEADTAGDWHVIQAKLAPLSTYTIEVEDYNGNKTSKKFTFHPHCKSDHAIPLTKVQTSPLFTFLSRPMLDLFRCENGMKFSAMFKDKVIEEDMCKAFKHRPITIGRLLEIYPEMTDIHYSADAAATGDGKAVNENISIYTFNQYQKSVNWSTNIGNITVSQKITGIPTVKDSTKRILAVTRTHTDSLDYLEFHPKGMQLKNWTVCIENPENNAPLYWLGETSRNWFIFSKQTKGKKRCATTNELRDIANINNEEAPILGFPYWGDMFIGGVRQPALRVPLMFKYDGIPDGNAITVTVGKKWVAAEYDSEPREIVIEGEKLPEAGGHFNIKLVDEAGHKASYDVDVPEM
ncbi:M23 family metallopeptidase [uncultured Fibrobacter sp.]|uniref:M23 family metallopeptidase n=1 Tax=uncultured Fibrobacter sp. TaxID=261512 RepID=UPI00260FC5DA|nr:M23 family metallopeptidase [uncultured Fibrobacter sp.]